MCLEQSGVYYKLALISSIAYEADLLGGRNSAQFDGATLCLVSPESSDKDGVENKHLKIGVDQRSSVSGVFYTRSQLELLLYLSVISLLSSSISHP